MLRLLSASALVAASLVLAPAAIAQEREPAAKPGGDPAPANEQRYNGLQLGSSTVSPLPKPNVKDSRTKLVWTGFQTTATGSRVFFQTTNPVEFGVKLAKSSIELKLKNCRIHLRNNARSLNTRFFPTPVRTVALRQRGKDVDVLLSLKEATESVPKSEPGPEGTTLLVLDFPPGKPDEAPVKSSDERTESQETDTTSEGDSDPKAQGKTKKNHVSRGTVSTISRDAPVENKGGAPAPTAPAPSAATPPADNPTAPPPLSDPFPVNSRGPAKGESAPQRR